MKPYGNTCRASKVHKATECGICSEVVDTGAKYERQAIKATIKQGELDRDDALQAAYNKEQDFEDFCNRY
jgi:hypothetical protein